MASEPCLPWARSLRWCSWTNGAHLIVFISTCTLKLSIPSTLRPGRCNCFPSSPLGGKDVLVMSVKVECPKRPSWNLESINPFPQRSLVSTHSIRYRNYSISNPHSFSHPAGALLYHLNIWSCPLSINVQFVLSNLSTNPLLCKITWAYDRCCCSLICLLHIKGSMKI